MTSTVETSTAANSLRLQGRSLGSWMLRRALIGLGILTCTVSLSAWLLYASIDQQAEASNSQVREAPATASEAAAARDTGAVPDLRQTQQ